MLLVAPDSAVVSTIIQGFVHILIWKVASLFAIQTETSDNSISLTSSLMSILAVNMGNRAILGTLSLMQNCFCFQYGWLNCHPLKSTWNKHLSPLPSEFWCRIFELECEYQYIFQGAHSVVKFSPLTKSIRLNWIRFSVVLFLYFAKGDTVFEHLSLK